MWGIHYGIKGKTTNMQFISGPTIHKKCVKFGKYILDFKQEVS